MAVVTEAKLRLVRARSLWERVRHGHVSWALLDQALVSGANFATSIALARALGLSHFGAFALAWMVVLFSASLQQALLISPMMVFGPRQAEGEARAYYGALFTWQVVGIGAWCVLVAAGAWLYGLVSNDATTQALVLPLAAANAAHLLQDFVRRYFFTRGLPRQAFLNDSVSYGGQVLALGALLLAGSLGVAEALTVIALSSFLALVVAVGQIAALPHRPLLSPGLLGPIALQHWHFSKWLLLSSQLLSFARYPVTWVLGAVAGTAAVGTMAAAGNLVGVLHVAFNGLDNSVLPQATRRLHQSGAWAAARFIGTITGAVGLGVAGFCAFMIVSPQPLARLFYGDMLAGYEGVIALFGATYLVIYLSKPLMYLLLITENSKRQSGVEFVKLLVTVSLCLPVISVFGLMGAMWLTLGVSVLGLVMLAIICAKVLAELNAPDGKEETCLDMRESDSSIPT